MFRLLSGWQVCRSIKGRERKGGVPGREFKRCLTAMLYVMFTFMFAAAAAAAAVKKEAVLWLCWAGLLAFLFLAVT
jgi:isoprenylcysteine carboxyl methyltransferase (ICMT) family protein YpbQ